MGKWTGEGTPSEFDFEAIRLRNSNAYPDWSPADHVLLPYGKTIPIASRNAKKHTLITSPLDALAHTSSLFWHSHVIESSYSDGTYHLEAIRSFAYDADDEAVEWMFITAKLPKFISKYFKAQIPGIWRGTFHGRFAIFADGGHLLLTKHDVWRDSDIARGVVAQYIIHDHNHPLWRKALWSAFSYVQPDFYT